MVTVEVITGIGSFLRQFQELNKTGVDKVRYRIKGTAFVDNPGTFRLPFDETKGRSTWALLKRPSNSSARKAQIMTGAGITGAAGWIVFVLMAWTTPMAADWSHIAFTRAEIQRDRQAIVAKFMHLNESQSEAFWPVYRDYRSAVAVADDRMVTILEHLIERHGVISDREADDLLDQYLTFEQEKLQVQYSYLKRFRTILPFKQVARLFQLENKMDAAVRYELATKVPLVD